MTIKEVSGQFDLTADTLRYYEKIGLMDPVPRNENGIRIYGDHDLRRVEFIKCMRTAGLSIEFLKEYVSLFNQGEHTMQQRKQILEDQRNILLQRMNDMQKTLDRLEFKIHHYDEVMADIERKTATRTDELE